MATAHWGEQAHALHFRKKKVHYRSGAPADASGRHPVVKVLRFLLLIPVLVLLAVVDGGGDLPSKDEPSHGIISLRNGPGGRARRFAAALAGSRKDLWIVFSRSCFALAHVRGKEQPSILWQAGSAEHPQFHQRRSGGPGPTVSWRWTDGSEAELLLSQRESLRLRENWSVA